MPRTPDWRARHHRQTHHDPDRVSIDRSSKATKNIHRPSAEPESRGKTRQSRSPPGGNRLADISTRRTMSQKRSRVDAESTRMKGSRPESLRRTTSTKDGRPKRTCLPDRTAQIHHQMEKRTEASPSVKKDRVTRQLSEPRLTGTEKAPSRRGSPSRKERANQVGPRGSIRPPRIPRKKESTVHSSLSGTTRSASSTSEESAGPPTAAEIAPRRHAVVPSRDRSPPKRVPPPRRRLSHHRTMRPSRVPEETTKADHEKKPEKRDGRLRRFKDKLAIIFHHHHHHHHHHHRHGRVDGDDAGKDGGAHHRRSPSKHARRTLHHRSEEDQGKLATEADAERAVAMAPEQHQHGYFRQLLGALVRHVWRSRKRKAVRTDRGRLGRSASRVRVKKLHWWQRFRRRGGVKLANGKKPRLRLGFSKTNPRTTKR